MTNQMRICGGLTACATFTCFSLAVFLFIPGMVLRVEGNKSCSFEKNFGSSEVRKCEKANDQKQTASTALLVICSILFGIGVIMAIVTCGVCCTAANEGITTTPTVTYPGRPMQMSTPSAAMGISTPSATMGATASPVVSTWRHDDSAQPPTPSLQPAEGDMSLPPPYSSVNEVSWPAKNMEVPSAINPSAPNEYDIHT